jgi:hypothetical protein
VLGWRSRESKRKLKEDRRKIKSIREVNIVRNSISK